MQCIGSVVFGWCSSCVTELTMFGRPFLFIFSFSENGEKWKERWINIVLVSFESNVTHKWQQKPNRSRPKTNFIRFKRPTTNYRTCRCSFFHFLRHRKEYENRVITFEHYWQLEEWNILAAACENAKLFNLKRIPFSLYTIEVIIKGRQKKSIVLLWLGWMKAMKRREWAKNILNENESRTAPMGAVKPSKLSLWNSEASFVCARQNRVPLFYIFSLILLLFVFFPLLSLSHQHYVVQSILYCVQISSYTPTIMAI